MLPPPSGNPPPNSEDSPPPPGDKAQPLGASPPRSAPGGGDNPLHLLPVHTQDCPCLLDWLRTLQQLLQDSFPLLVRQSSARTDTQGLHLGHGEGGGGLLEGDWESMRRQLDSCRAGVSAAGRENSRLELRPFLAAFPSSCILTSKFSSFPPSFPFPLPPPSAPPPTPCWARWGSWSAPPL